MFTRAGTEIFFFQALCFRAFSPTFAVLSQTAGSGVLTEWLEIPGFSPVFLKK